MGFFDKVKSTVDDVSGTVGKKIDVEKYEMKIRDEQRNIDKASLEIGKIVTEQLLNGRPFDKSMVMDQYNIIVESNRRIEEYTMLRNEITGESTPPKKEIVTEYEVENYDSVPAAKAKPALPEPDDVAEPTLPEPEPVVEEHVVSIPVETKPEPPVQEYVPEPEPVSEPIAESKPEPLPSAQCVETLSPEVETGGCSKVENPEEGSMLSRIQSYKSGNYSGKNL